ncbi:MAG: methyltransferase domain-containing protein [Bacteroidota bacterium]
MIRQAELFDEAAKVYDAEFTHSAIGKLQRGRVWHYLSEYLPLRKLSILEVNCGTGEDAIWMARKGHSVTATDISAGMITVCQGKQIIYGLNNLVFEKAGFFDVAHLYMGRRFDVIFSDFGGLNCVDDEELFVLSGRFSSLLYEKGKLIIVVMGRKCLWEQLYFLSRLSFSKAFRRKRRAGVSANIGGKSIFTHYYSPSDIEALFGEHFNVVRKRPVGFAIPPSYMEKFFERRPRLLNFLGRMERFFGNLSFLANRSDHYIIELEKK